MMEKAVFLRKNMILKTLQLITVTTAASAVLFTATNAFAAGASGVPCQEVYGGNCQPGTITITKTVQDPITKQFVKNLGVNDHTYAPEQKVTFHIDVANTGDTELDGIQVQDQLPQYVTYTSGDGSFDANTKLLTDTISKLNGHETKELTVVATIANSNSLPSDKGTVCVVNQAQATQNGNTVSDTAQFCIQKPITGTLYPVQKQAPTTPSTGPETLPLLGLLPTAFTGVMLRRKTTQK